MVGVGVPLILNESIVACTYKLDGFAGTDLVQAVESSTADDSLRRPLVQAAQDGSEQQG